ncbi:MAG: hypothetical protein K2H93_07440, partial [Oscillospiraceae bacterium]|nr:hypothetical protein [Oscillospiraceae bacterium]
AQAQADANKLIEASLSDKVLVYNQIDKWNGVLQKVTSGNNNLMIDIPIEENNNNNSQNADSQNSENAE